MTRALLRLISDPRPNTADFRYWTVAVVVTVALLALTRPSISSAQSYSPGNEAGESRDYDRRGPDDRGRGEQRNRGDAIVRCESTDRGYRHCPADTRDGVKLRRQLSKNVCRYQDSWGFDRRGIWVDQGCRAEFELYTGRSGGDGKPKKDKDNTAAIVGGAVALGVLGAIIADNDKDDDQAERPRRLVRCESDGDYRLCRADVRNRVSLYRQLGRASCRQNQSWGYDRRGVWVDRGCRAEFALD